MSAYNYKIPPSLNDTTEYEKWVKEVKLWKLCSKIDKKEQGPALALSLTGNAREAALEMPLEELNADDGADKLITKLDGLFLKDEHQRTYVAYSTFEKYTRPATMSIDAYINEFERLYNKVKAHTITLPDQVLAYRLLESANLDYSKTELIRTTLTALGYKEMKTQLRKLEDIAVTKEGGNEPFIKVKNEADDVLYTQSYNRGYRGYRSRGRGASRVYRGRGGYASSSFNSGSRNPLDTKGKPSRCYNCQSVYHWASECPEKRYFAQGRRKEEADRDFGL